MTRRLKLLCAIAGAILLVNSAVLWALPMATAFNVANLLLHIGLVAVVGLAALLLLHGAGSQPAAPRLIGALGLLIAAPS